MATTYDQCDHHYKQWILITGTVTSTTIADDEPERVDSSDTSVYSYASTEGSPWIIKFARGVPALLLSPATMKPCRILSNRINIDRIVSNRTQTLHFRIICYHNRVMAYLVCPLGPT